MTIDFDFDFDFDYWLLAVSCWPLAIAFCLLAFSKKSLAFEDKESPLSNSLFFAANIQKTRVVAKNNLFDKYYCKNWNIADAVLHSVSKTRYSLRIEQ